MDVWSYGKGRINCILPAKRLSIWYHKHMASLLKYIIFFSLLLFIHIPVLSAQAPSPTTAAPKKVNAGVPNDTIDISKPGTFTQQITELNFEFGKGGLTPSEDFSIADFENSAKMLESTALQPKMIQDI